MKCYVCNSRRRTMSLGSRTGLFCIGLCWSKCLNKCHSQCDKLVHVHILWDFLINLLYHFYLERSLTLIFLESQCVIQTLIHWVLKNLHDEHCKAQTWAEQQAIDNALHYCQWIHLFFIYHSRFLMICFANSVSLSELSLHCFRTIHFSQLSRRQSCSLV